jgi:ABC-2 type transport system permease protein
MSARVTSATATRVLAQLRRDPQTLALVLVAPCVIVALAKYLLADQPETFDRIGGPMLGLFPFIQMFLITSITVLRERTSGTLERLLAMPLAKLDILAGYALAFALLAAAQAAAVSAVAFGLLGLDVTGPASAVLALAIANALLGVSLGLLVSAIATTEFQATEFMPAFILPQILLCGLLVPRDQMAPALQTLADALPLTYAFDALDRVARGDGLSGRLTIDVAVIAAVTLTALALGTTTLRRRTP